jgi:HEAT repeat protein
MNTPMTTRISAAALQQALDALKTYAAGSARGALAPLDDAVAAATTDPSTARELERRLLELLDGAVPVEAREYVCRKLILIGSAASVPKLTALLKEAATTSAAREVLQLLPGPEAGDALRHAMSSLSGLSRVGAIISLGLRREAASAACLAPLLREADVQAACAAAGALGELGTAAAAEALRDFLPQAPALLRSAVADASLACAERLASADEARLAAELYRLLNSSEQAPHVRHAAAQGQARLLTGA